MTCKLNIIRLLLFLTLFASAISADAQRNLERPRALDNWSVALSGGLYHPMFYDLKYLADCSGWAGALEVRRDVVPGLGVGVEGDFLLRMAKREERKDPRSLVGPIVHFNLLNIILGYEGKPRFFEFELNAMPAWGHLFRGSKYEIFHDEDYLAAKFGADFNFHLGRQRDWTLSLKPALVTDFMSLAPTPKKVNPKYDVVDWKKTDLQIFVGCSYNLSLFGSRKHFEYVIPTVGQDEVEHLNEIINYLRSDIRSREAEIERLKQEVERQK